MPGVTVDGMDVFAVFDAASEAIARARRDEGPSLVECKTERYYGHFDGDAALYRTKAELEAAKKRDCILHFERTVLQEKWLSEAALRMIKIRSEETVREAVRFAEDSPWPKPEECLDDVYVSY